jgi:hypothetical protein
MHSKGRPGSYEAFYAALFAPLEQLFGPLDPEISFPIIGFGAGGPVKLATIGRGDAARAVTYVTCELACWEEQLPNESGRYELLMSCDDETWCRSVLTSLGRMSFEETLDDRHTVDILAWVGANCPIQGLLLERIYAVEVNGESFNVLRVLGLKRNQLTWGLKHGVDDLSEKMQSLKHYPHVRLRA